MIEAKYIGFALSVLGNSFIGVGLNLQKYAHKQIARAPAGREISYTQMPSWWAGVSLMVGGEAGNFIAFGFAPASLVAPLGFVGVVVNIFMASRYLDEVLRPRDLVGCLIALAGAMCIVSWAPTIEHVVDVPKVLEYMRDPIFLAYIISLIIVVVYLMTKGQEQAESWVVIDVLVCSLLGSVTVMSAKAMSTFIRLTIEGDSQLKSPLFYLLVVVAAATGILQVQYLNKAMKNFGSSEVVPVYYVLFTLASISGGIVFYKEFDEMSYMSIQMFIIGCLCAFAGVWLMTSGRPSPEKEVHPPDTGDKNLDKLFIGRAPSVVDLTDLYKEDA